MLSFWQQMPFVRFLIPLILGILASEHLHYNPSKPFILLILSGSSLFLLWFVSYFIKRFKRNGLFLQCLCFIAGIFISNNHLSLHYHQHFSFSKSTYFLAKIQEAPQPASIGYKATATILSGINQSHKTEALRGQIMLYFKDSVYPVYGDLIIINSGFLQISSPQNPGTFDYACYMQNKGIEHQMWLSKGKWKACGINHGNPLMRKSYAFQEFIKSTLNKYLQSPQEVAISEALLYGYDKGMDDETIQDYSRTGTLHVLAVSGMHVGLIFTILSFLLKPLARTKRSKYLIAFLEILGIWLYSVLCGLSPSILRAALMFSFIILGKEIKRSSNPFNSLAASAFALLCFDPKLIYQVGFQLSYAAVAGILGFYKPLYFLFTFKNRLSNEIWKVCAVSLSAQVLTLPLSIAYFHQFPNYFLPANLIIIPLSSLIIYTGILLLILAPFETAALMLAKIIAFLIHLCNGFASFMANLPGAVSDQLNWYPSLHLAYFLLLIWAVLYFIKPNILYVYLMAGCLLFAQTDVLVKQYRQRTQPPWLCIYSLKKGYCLMLAKNKTGIVFGSAQLRDGSKTFKNLPLAHANSLHMRLNPNVYLKEDNLYLQINTTRTLFVWQNDGVPKNLNIDFLLVCGDSSQNLSQMLSQNKVKRVILGANLKATKRKALKKIAQIHKVAQFDIAESGAFELSL